TVIKRLRKAAAAEGRSITIMADLPGPKIRVGQLKDESVILKQGDEIILTVEEIVGDAHRVFVSFPPFPHVVKPGDQLFLNDGNIHLEVIVAKGDDVVCSILVGGELRSRKGLNLPGIDLGISAFTTRDQECLKFALEHGVDAISQSFVAGASDLHAVREAAQVLGYAPFIIAKIERSQALQHVDEILQAADGIMIARGDLGVEIPLETIAVIQKQLTSQANLLGKPVITATQMLESMVTRSRPTRAEVTDVANAILDGTDCVMLSEESAMGHYPSRAAAMLASIASATEPHREGVMPWENIAGSKKIEEVDLADFISRNVQQAVKYLNPTAVIVPTASGHTARMISRFKLPLWISAVNDKVVVCRGLEFSYGVFPSCEVVKNQDWDAFSRSWAAQQGLPEGLVVLLQGPSEEHPEVNPSLEIITMVTASKKEPENHN
ncbi:MAG: pyruvate kinase, partial [Candidatus Hydrogenedentes bacterium]|nr:pyruvate kinase [Candidatus Hydrogenedentota bacterium]